MSEGHGDPPADVRSFLPRPGEPVEEYAQRLRALHRDLTLVLEAVERGLAAAAGEAEPAPVSAPPGPEPERFSTPVGREPRDVHVTHGPPPPAPTREPLLPGGARVEVLPAASGEQVRLQGEERRAPAAPPAAPEEPADPFAAEGEAAEPPRAQRLPARPSATALAEPEPEWVHRGPPSETFTAATFGPPAPAGGPSPVLLAALVAGWLTVVALALALLVG